MFDFQEIVNVDPEIAELIQKEQQRQEDRVELIASENFVSKAVMAMPNLQTSSRIPVPRLTLLSIRPF